MKSPVQAWKKQGVNKVSYNPNAVKEVYDRSPFQKYSDFMVDVDIRQDYYTMISSRHDIINLPAQSGVFSGSNAQHANNLADKASKQELLEKLS